MLHDLIVIGAGPVGLEVGLAAAQAGLDVLLLERGEVAENLRRWGFVRLFSPWEQNTTARGRALCESDVAADAYLSGHEFRDLYWLPLARSSALAGRIREGCRVRNVGRAGAFKDTRIGDPGRAKLPFHVLAESGGREMLFRARQVVDASGVYGNHRWLGPGGIPAIGEREAAASISYELLDLQAEPESWAGRTLMVVGAGYSACTALEQLLELRASGIDLRAHWVHRSEGHPPMRVVPDDPLPYRQRLATLANELADDPPPWLTLHRGTGVESLARSSRGVRVRLGGQERELEVDRLLAYIGSKPDRSLSEELQFHECWATSGPMKLAAALLAQEAEAGGDCLSLDDTGPETLRNPEPGFYVLGAKSYGRNPDFLIQRGHAQIETVMRFLMADLRAL